MVDAPVPTSRPLCPQVNGVGAHAGGVRAGSAVTRAPDHFVLANGRDRKHYRVAVRVRDPGDTYSDEAVVGRPECAQRAAAAAEQLGGRPT